MSSNAEETAKTAQEQEQNEQQSQQEWETMARAWLSSFPEAKEVSMAEVEAWIDSNLAFLPAGLRSMPRPDLCLRLISIQNCMRFPTPQGAKTSQEHEQNGQSQQEWQTMARAWLCSFPEAKEVMMPEVESWINSNLASLPEGLRSVPPHDICLRLISVQNRTRFPIHEESANQLDPPHARFQRTDQWLPVYSWLETLDKDEVVNSKEITDWLTENPEVQEQLSSRHSRHHLKHYIKKCHLKILKRREIGKPVKDISFKAQQDVVMEHQAPLPSSYVNKLPKDSDLYLAKRVEAYRKYQFLVELEKRLSPVFSEDPKTNETASTASKR